MAAHQHAGQAGGGQNQRDEEADYPETPSATQPSTVDSSASGA
jgi:hypothetical protein